jgi:hypothetical protein
MSRDFDPASEQQNVVLIDAETLRQAERRIESYDHCNPEEAQIRSTGFWTALPDRIPR